MVKTPNRHTELCPACGEGKLSSQVKTRNVTYSGFRQDVTFHFSTCDICGCDLVNKDESLLNNRAMAAFRKTVNNFLTGSEIRSFRELFGLTQVQAAQLFGGGVVAFSRYENDDITQSAAMDSLIRLCVNHPVNLEYLAEIKGIPLSRKCVDKIEEYVVKSAYTTKIAERAKKKLDKDILEKYARPPTAKKKGITIPAASWESASYFHSHDGNNDEERAVVNA